MVPPGSGWPPQGVVYPGPGRQPRWPILAVQAGVSDLGTRDVICNNAISGAGHAPLDATSSLPNPPPPAFVRPVDTVSGPAIAPVVYDNTFNGLAYHQPDREEPGRRG